MTISASADALADLKCNAEVVLGNSGNDFRASLNMKCVFGCWNCRRVASLPHQPDFNKLFDPNKHFFS